MSHYHQSHQPKAKKFSHAKSALTYGEIHLHIMQAVDAIRSRWPGSNENEVIERLTTTARRIMENRRNGVPVIIKRNTDLID